MGDHHQSHADIGLATAVNVQQPLTHTGPKGPTVSLTIPSGEGAPLCGGPTTSTPAPLGGAQVSRYGYMTREEMWDPPPGDSVVPEVAYTHSEDSWERPSYTDSSLSASHGRSPRRDHSPTPEKQPDPLSAFAGLEGSKLSTLHTAFTVKKTLPEPVSHPKCYVDTRQGWGYFVKGTLHSD